MTTRELCELREKSLDCLKSDFIRSHLVDHFPKYALHCYVSRFLSRAKIFEQIVNVHGSIIECGVGTGFSLFTWYQLNRIFEPFNRRRIIYGFDTFAGFPHVDVKDGDHGKGEQDLGTFEMMRSTGNNMLCANGGTDLPWSQIELVEGDFTQTWPHFMDAHPHLVVALLHLDFDLYAATKKAIEIFVPRMPKGGVICFDELDHPEWPGETIAVMEMMGLNKLRLRRLSFEPTMSYAVIE